MEHSDELSKLYAGLKALSETSFPKRCSSCGRTYPSTEEFIRETRSVRGGASGLKSSRDESDRSIIELFRNCPCGSTLMDYFDDRRDLTPESAARRRLFDELTRTLQKKGLAKGVARAELLKILAGEQSHLLTSLGIQVRIR
jgi:hypothetical protein